MDANQYASQFATVEIDGTFYDTPAASTITSWNKRTPQDFIFAVKVPQVITHEKVLVAVSMFLGVEDRLTLPNPAASIN